MTPGELVGQDDSLSASFTSTVVAHVVDGDRAELERLRADVEHLRKALATRDLMWTAKTIIAASTGCGPDEAHRILVRQSQHENRKMREVAAEIVEHYNRRQHS